MRNHYNFHPFTQVLLWKKTSSVILLIIPLHFSKWQHIPQEKKQKQNWGKQREKWQVNFIPSDWKVYLKPHSSQLQVLSMHSKPKRLEYHLQKLPFICMWVEYVQCRQVCLAHQDENMFLHWSLQEGMLRIVIRKHPGTLFFNVKPKHYTVEAGTNFISMQNTQIWHSMPKKGPLILDQVLPLATGTMLTFRDR